MEKKKMVLVALALILFLLILTIVLVNNSLIKKGRTPAKDTDLPGDGDNSEGAGGSGIKHPDGAVANPDGTYTYPDGLVYDAYGNLIPGAVPGGSLAGGNALNGGLNGTLTPDQEAINNLEFYKYTGIQAAEKIESFMRSMRKQDGTYYFSETCGEQKSGPEQVQNNNWAIMAYSSLYDKTKKDLYKTRLLTDWDISAADKTSADLYTSYQLYQLHVLSEKNPTLLTAIDKEGLYRKINSVGSSVITGYEPMEDYAMIIATLSRASFLSSMLTKETESDDSPEVFNNAEDLLEKADAKNEIILFEKNGEELEEGRCWVELARLQKHDLTGQNALLDSGKSYFSALDFDTEFETPKLLDNSIPMNLLSCTEALLILHEKTGDNSYLDDAKSILGAYLKYNWDLPERKFCSGDYGILAKRKASDESGRKVLTDNAYFIYLLSDDDIKDYEFKWLK